MSVAKENALAPPNVRRLAEKWLISRVLRYLNLRTGVAQVGKLAEVCPAFSVQSVPTWALLASSAFLPE
jgi:hypothetical protein